MYLRMKGPVVPGGRHPADAMYEGVAVRRQQFADFAEILVEMTNADMFHHTDRNHPVEAARDWR